MRMEIIQTIPIMTESSDSDDEPELGVESDGGSDGDNGNEEDAEE